MRSDFENEIWEGPLIAVHPLFALLDQWKSKLTTFSLDTLFDESQVESLYDHVKAMDNLTQLSLGFIMTSQRPLPNRLARLERLAIESTEAHSGLLQDLNPACTHLWMDNSVPITASHLREWFRVKPGLFAQLTRLRVYQLSTIDAMDLLCKHVSTALCHLEVWFCTMVRIAAF